jgi:hypothetical protein
MNLLEPFSVTVRGGKFITHVYKISDGNESKGVEIVIEFQPNNQIGRDGETISLVQTVRDRMKLTRFRDEDGHGKDITPQPKTSQLGNRKLVSTDSAVTEDDIDTGIDQNVLSEDGMHVINLDPRYTERSRMLETQELNVKGFQLMNPWSARSARKTGGIWSSAVLNDSPELKETIPGVATKDDLTAITGSMQFEIAALLNEQNMFLGSVIWGWMVDNTGTSVLFPNELTPGNYGTATPRFFKAARKWNITHIVDPTTGQHHIPMQLPTQ